MTDVSGYQGNSTYDASLTAASLSSRVFVRKTSPKLVVI